MLGEIMTFHCGIDGSTKRPTFQDSRTWRTDIGMSKTKKTFGNSIFLSLKENDTL